MIDPARRQPTPHSAPRRIHLLSILSLAALLPSVLAQNPPWEAQTFDFGWNPYNSTLTQCRVLGLSWNTRTGASPTPVAPYTAVIWANGQQPYTINVGTGPNYGWLVNLPVGGPYMLSMYDSAGGNGGVSDVFNILTANPASCAPTPFTPASLQLNIGSVTSQCGVMPITVTGGTPPYRLMVLPEVYPPKTASYSTGEFNYTLDVVAGTNVFFGVEDANGKGAVAPMFNVQAGNTACQNLAATLAPGAPALTSINPGISSTASSMAPSSTSGTSTDTASVGGASTTGTGTPLPTTKKKSNIGAIVGGVVAGVVVLILAAIWLLTRYRRNRSSIQATQHRDIDHPHVEPFGGVTIEPMMTEGWHPGSMAATHQPGVIPIAAAPAASSPKRESWTSSSGTTSSAALMNQARDSKTDPTRNSMATVIPSTPSTSLRPTSSQYPPTSPTTNNRYSEALSSSGATVDPYWGQPAPVRSTSPPLPPGAASPSPIMGAFEGMGRSNTTATSMDRMKTPPPQYSERPVY